MNPNYRKSSNGLTGEGDGLISSVSDMYANPQPVEMTREIMGQPLKKSQGKSTGNLFELLESNLITVSNDSAMGSHRRARNIDRDSVYLDQLLSGTEHTDACGQQHRSKTNTPVNIYMNSDSPDASVDNASNWNHK